MKLVSTAEQHRALLTDCWELAQALPLSGVLDRGRRPYRAIRFERKLTAVAQDPVGLLEYVRGMARRTSEGLESLVEYNRLDLSVEMLIIDESKIYASLFTPEDRAAARAKLDRQTGQVVELVRDRAKQLEDEETARRARIDARCADLPEGIEELRRLAAQATDLEDVVAINTLILRQASRDVVAMNRLGPGYEAIGSIDRAREAYQQAIAVDPINQIATRRLHTLDRSAR